MENDKVVIDDTSNITEDGTVEVVEGESVEDKAARLEEANKKLFERAKKAEGFIKQADGTWVKKPQTQKIIKEEKNVPDVDSLKEEIWTIADYIREGYDRKDVEFIMRNGGREALNDPNSYVSVALKSKLEQRRAEAEASKTSNSGGMSEIERKYTPEQLRNMSSEELKKILPQA